MQEPLDLPAPASSNTHTAPMLGPKMGDNVLIEQISGKQFLARIYPDMKVSIGRQQVSCRELLENPYGASFEMKGKKLVSLWRNKSGDLENASSGDCADLTGPTDQVNQDDPEDPAARVGELRAACTGYDSKSSFGRDKWERRQRASHFGVFRVLPVTPYTLCKYYAQSKSSVQSSELSPETLASCIAQGLPSPRVKRLLIYDDSNGIFTASVLWRMKGDPEASEILVAGCSSGDISDRCKELNLVPKRKTEPGSAEGVVIPRVAPVPLFRLANPADLADYTAPLPPSPTSDVSTPKPRHEPKRAPGDERPHERLPEVWNSKVLEKVMAKTYSRDERDEPWLANALLICSRCRILPILRVLIPFTKSGAHMAACSRDPEVLCECGKELLQKAACCNFRMSECFDTEMQVIEGMTHPAMSMEMPMSYVISCIITTKPEKP